MHIEQKRSHRKQTKIILISTLSLLLIGTVVYAWFSPNVPFLGVRMEADQPENTINQDEPTSGQQAAGSKAKEEFIGKHDDKIVDSNGVDQDVNISIFITSLSQRDATLQVRTQINSTLSTGECMVTLSRVGSQDLIQSSEVQSMPSYTTCKGFDLSVSDLERGEWTVKVQYVGPDGSGDVSKTVDLK